MSNPWYSFYPGDYGRDTAHLSLVEDGVYRRLLDHYYSTGRPIPTRVEQVFRICRAFAPAEQEAVSYILQQFFVEESDGWHNSRVDRELVKARDIGDKRSKAGKESARKRSGANPTRESAPDEHVLTQPQPHSQPQSLSQPEPNPPLLENAVVCSKVKNHSQTDFTDFDARDLRKLSDAYKKIELKLLASVGSGNSLTEKDVFEWACQEAGISVARGLDVQERGRKWPQDRALEASA